MLFKLNNIPTIGLRFFNVYGPRQDPFSAYSGVISIFAKQIINNKPIKINGGQQTRDFIFVNDVTKCIYNSYEILKKNNICETVNVLSNKSTSIDDLANLMMKIIGKYPEKIYQPLLKGDPLKSIGSFGKMERIFQISMNEITDLEKGLIETVNYLKKEKKLKNETFEWAVIGGGISGISISEILSRHGHKTILIEKNNDLASETSKVFHEWLHSGASIL